MQLAENLIGRYLVSVTCTGMVFCLSVLGVGGQVSAQTVEPVKRGYLMYNRNTSDPYIAAYDEEYRAGNSAGWNSGYIQYRSFAMYDVSSLGYPVTQATLLIPLELSTGTPFIYHTYDMSANTAQMLLNTAMPVNNKGTDPDPSAEFVAAFPAMWDDLATGTSYGSATDYEPYGWHDHSLAISLITLTRWPGSTKGGCSVSAEPWTLPCPGAPASSSGEILSRS